MTVRGGSRRLVSALTGGQHVRTSWRVRLFVYCCLALLLYLVFLGSVLPQSYNLSSGQVSQVTIRAPIDAVDVHATRMARLAAAALVRARYDVNPAANQAALGALDHLFNQAQSLRASKGPVAKRAQSLRSAAPPGLSPGILPELISMSGADFAVVRSDTLRIVQQILQLPFSSSDMKRAGMMVDQHLVSLDAGKAARLVIGRLVESVLRPNLVYDPVLTQAARLQAERNVPDVWINRGDVVVRRGELITPAIMSQLKDLKLLKAEPNYGLVIGFLVFIATLVVAVGAFIQSRNARLAVDNVELTLYATLVLVVAILIRLTKAGVEAGLPSAVAYGVPTAMGSMMTAMFFGTSLGMMTSLLISVLFSAAMGFEFAYFFTPLIAGLGASMAFRRVQHRKVFMRTGFLTAGLNVLTIATVHFLLISTSSGLHTLMYDEVYGVAGGLLSAVLTIGLLPYLETAFGVVTHMGLLELANPNHPLLRKLLLEAPGTYHHSLIVGNLAEAAAEVVGADPLVCRVGSYYHDVGKIKRPMFFVENQIAGENPHDKVAPNLSHLIITAHVADGMEMLREYRMPGPVQEICAQHHGTTVLWYFYHRAVEEERHGIPQIDQFRYPGPKPRSKEAAIVMMCDAVEASVRSLGKPTPARIEAMIRKLIKDRLQDGQFDECDITLQDLDRMVGAFLRTLQGVYHERIEYPDAARALEARAR